MELPGSRQRREIVLAKTNWILNLELAGMEGLSGAFTVPGVGGRTESWGLKLLCYLLCLQGSDTEEKESRSSVTSSPNDKQIDLALCSGSLSRDERCPIYLGEESGGLATPKCRIREGSP